jgi:predicted metal-dependent peptidase
VTPEQSADPAAALGRAADQAAKALAAARAALVLGRDAASAFFATLALRLVPRPDESVPTLATDGRALAYNPGFVAALPAAELVGVVAHEVLHCALAHPARRGTRDPGRWNVACDLAVNPLLLGAGFTLPAGRLVPGEGRYAPLPPGRSAEEYYARLDTSRGPDLPDVPDPGGCGGVIDPAGGDPAAARQLAAEWRVAVAQAERAARGRGPLPAGLGRAADAVLHPPADWRAVLRDFVAAHARNDYAWLRPSRRFLAAGLYLPGLHSEQLGDVVLAVDTSGSVGPRELGVFAAEAAALLAAYDCTATVLYHDAVVQKVQPWRPADGPLVLAPVGGGGTDHACVFAWLARSGLDPACVVCLTDLDTAFPATPPAVPVLWAVVGGRPAIPPFGRRLDLGG